MRIVLAACFFLLLTVPIMAQDDSGSIHTSMGYANLSFPDLVTGLPGHHSGFVNQTDFNLSKTFGLDNYMGIYGLGQGSTLVSDFFGGKVMYPRGKVVPYALAGLGFGYFSVSSTAGSGSASAFGTRFGGGMTIPINDSLSWKVEYSRMNFHLATSANSNWTAGNNLAAGIVFKLSN